MGSQILALAIDASVEAGFTTPASLFGIYDEGDTTPQKLRRALTKTVQLLAATWDWQVLRRERIWTSLASQTQTGMVPDDFLRFIDGTFWDRSNKFRLRGPLSPEEWQTAVSWQTGAVTPYFCQRGGDILTYPTPSSGRIYAFEYISNQIGTASDGAARSAFSADTDTTLWDDELIIQGIVTHYRELNRLESANERYSFERLMHDRIKQDGGRRKINMCGRKLTAADRLGEMRSAAVIAPNNGPQWGGSDW